MKTERRHELKTNILAKWLGKEITDFKPYLGWVIGGSIAVILIVLLFSLRTTMSEDALEASWAERADAELAANQVLLQSSEKFDTETERLETLIRENSGTALATFTTLDLGDLYMRRGSRLSERDKNAAKESFDKALNSYATVLKIEPLNDVIKNRARLSLARTYEWLSNLEKAKENYKLVEGTFQKKAEASLAALERSNMVAFYEKFADYVPTAPTPSFPANRPKTGPGNFSTPDSFKDGADKSPLILPKEPLLTGGTESNEGNTNTTDPIIPLPPESDPAAPSETPTEKPDGDSPATDKSDGGDAVEDPPGS